MLVQIRTERHRYISTHPIFITSPVLKSVHIVIQNGYEELWTVLNWTNPGAVGTRKQWKSYVEEPLRIGQSRSATDDQHVRAAVSMPNFHIVYTS